MEKFDRQAVPSAGATDKLIEPNGDVSLDISCTTNYSSIVSIENSYGSSCLTGLSTGTCTITITTEDGGHTSGYR